MEVGKLINGTAELIEVENGIEVGGERTEEELYALGYKKACPMPRPSEEATENWREYPTCLVQEWIEPAPEPDPDEITAEEALDIITGGTV